MIKENIKYFFGLGIVMFIYYFGSFAGIDIIQSDLLHGQRSLIIEISYCLLDFLCALGLFYIGYKNNKLKNCIAVMIFSFFVLYVSLLTKNIYPSYMAFFGFSMLSGTIVKIVRTE